MNAYICHHCTRVAVNNQNPNPERLCYRHLFEVTYRHEYGANNHGYGCPACGGDTVYFHIDWSTQRFSTRNDAPSIYFDYDMSEHDNSEELWISDETVTDWLVREIYNYYQARPALPHPWAFIGRPPSASAIWDSPFADVSHEIAVSYSIQTPMCTSCDHVIDVTLA